MNLKGPRLAVQRDGPNVAPRGYWTDQFTFVQLRYEFLDSADESLTGTPVELPRTFLTFYDFDTGKGADESVEGSQVQIEALQMGPQATYVDYFPGGEVKEYSSWTEILNGNQTAVLDRSYAAWQDWQTKVYSGSEYGVGADNPITPDQLTDLQV